MKSKAQIMAERRARLKAEGLVSVQVHIPPAARARLTRYVETHLSGRVSSPRPKRNRDKE